MHYAGASTTHRSGFGAGQGPADIKKTFLYNQKLTTNIFQILEDHPNKVLEQESIASKVE